MTQSLAQGCHPPRRGSSWPHPAAISEARKEPRVSASLELQSSWSGAVPASPTNTPASPLPATSDGFVDPTVLPGWSPPTQRPGGPRAPRAPLWWHGMAWRGVLTAHVAVAELADDACVILLVRGPLVNEHGRVGRAGVQDDAILQDGDGTGGRAGAGPRQLR